jgi:predicted house-cleaning noncanonical NTP pyrophosphatase (MazG superfamily)
MKLIRDKYEDIIENNKIFKVDNNDTILKKHLLHQKLKEEINELIDSDFKDIYEYADVLEVLETLIYFNNIQQSEVLEKKKEKKEKYGGFENFLILK